MKEQPPLFSMLKHNIEVSDVQIAMRGSHLSFYFCNAASEVISERTKNYFIAIRTKYNSNIHCIIDNTTHFAYQNVNRSCISYTSNFAPLPAGLINLWLNVTILQRGVCFEVSASFLLFSQSQSATFMSCTIN